jgi:hypothetical protein
LNAEAVVEEDAGGGGEGGVVFAEESDGRVANVWSVRERRGGGKL